LANESDDYDDDKLKRIEGSHVRISCKVELTNCSLAFAGTQCSCDIFELLTFRCTSSDLTLPSAGHTPSAEDTASRDIVAIRLMCSEKLDILLKI